MWLYWLTPAASIVHESLVTGVRIRRFVAVGYVDTKLPVDGVFGARYVAGLWGTAVRLVIASDCNNGDG